jgi:ATP-binding cassette subfamily C protein CydD
MARGPVDPRLLKYATASRWFFVADAITSVVQTVSIVAIAWGLSQVISGLIDGSSLTDLTTQFRVLALGILFRAASTLLLDVVSARGAARVKSELRVKVVASVTKLGPGWLSTRNSASVTTVVGPGLDALDGYFAKFLPQLIATATGVPIFLIVLLDQDVATAVIVAVTLPVIPMFMVLVGWATGAAQRKQWTALTTLASNFLEVVEGLATLSIFGRQHRQAERIEKITDEYRSRTMSVLKVTFISGFVLELAGSLSVAVVAVSIGIRLVEGSVALSLGLFVLLLAPEVYLPIRQVGAQFHASADGIAAAEDVFEILEAPVQPQSHSATRSADRRGVFDVRDLTVVRGERTVVDDFSVELSPGTLTVIAGPSGAGKSTIVAAMLGFVPYSGSLSFNGGELDASQSRSLIAWAGQRPALAAGTVAENIALGEADDRALHTAMRIAAADLIPPELELGTGGSGLSGGQAQRVALARAVYRSLVLDTPLLVLDEPTSALDLVTEAEVIRNLAGLAREGKTVVIISHRADVIEAADTVIELRGRIEVAA